MLRKSHPCPETEDLVVVLSLIIAHAVSEVFHPCLDALPRLVGGAAAHSSSNASCTRICQEGCM